MWITLILISIPVNKIKLNIYLGKLYREYFESQKLLMWCVFTTRIKEIRLYLSFDVWQTRMRCKIANNPKWWLRHHYQDVGSPRYEQRRKLRAFEYFGKRLHISELMPVLCSLLTFTFILKKLSIEMCEKPSLIISHKITMICI